MTAGDGPSTGPGAARPSRVGCIALALVFAGIPLTFIGFGVVLIAYGMFIAFAMVLADARDRRRLSLPAIAALVLGIAWVLLVGTLGRS